MLTYGGGEEVGEVARNARRTCTVTPLENLEPAIQIPFILKLVSYQQSLFNPQPITYTSHAPIKTPLLI